MEWFFSSYWWKRLTSNQIRKIQKKMKKSYKKADKLKKQLEIIDEKEKEQADKFLDDMLEKIT